MYAIIKTGGKQYKVAEGSTITVEKLKGEPESTVELTDVLMVSGEDGLQVGTPTLEGAKVVATIVAQGKGKKINAVTFKPKKNESRRYGHRQLQTRLHIDSIDTGSGDERPAQAQELNGHSDVEQEVKTESGAEQPAQEE